MSGLRIRLRWRLALSVALITFLVVASFALIISRLTDNFLSNDLNQRTSIAAQGLAKDISLGQIRLADGRFNIIYRGPSLNDYTSSEGAIARIVNSQGNALLSNGRPLSNDSLVELGKPDIAVTKIGSWRVASVPIAITDSQKPAYLQYALPTSQSAAAMSRINLFLIIGVIFATTLSTLLALAVSRRLLDPIRALTTTSREISQTRNLDIGFPQLKKDDEFAELSLTLGEMIHSLEESRDDLRHSLDRQRQLVADASHELRTPLTSIITNLDILADDLDGPDAELASSAERSAKRMQRIIEDLLLLARSDRQSEQISRQAVDLSATVAWAADELSSALKDHYLYLGLPEPLIVSGDNDALQRLASNLLANAARHCPAGSKISCQTRLYDEKTALLTVADNGPGIAAEEQSKIFERFYRVGGDQGPQGSGLGLAIVKTITEQHQGAVTLGEGIDGRGVAFHVFLPLEQS